MQGKEIQMIESNENESASPHDADEQTTGDANGDATIHVPNQPALDAGISEEWDRKNARRLDLVERESHAQLTPEEKAELEELQETFFAYIETIFPRSRILDDDRLEKLEKKYKDSMKS
jgi:hypothetical protein